MSNSSDNRSSKDQIDFRSHDIDQWSGEPLMAVFFLSLEQSLALPAGSLFHIIRYGEPVHWVGWNGGFNFIGMRIHRPQEDAPYSLEKDRAAFSVAREEIGLNSEQSEGIFQDQYRPSPARILGTVVEAATVLLPTSDGIPQHAVSQSFDRCLEGLRWVMQTYSTVTGDIRFRSISRQTCRPIVPWTTQTVDGGWGPLRMFHVHHGIAHVPFAADELTPDEIHQLGVRIARQVSGDPLFPYLERGRVARRAYLIDGDYPTSIIHSYTACELLLNTVLLMMVWEEGKPFAHARGWFEGQQGFMARINRQIVPRLGGNWGTQSAESPMSRLKRLADLRHQAVHYGYLPDEADAQQATETVEALEEFVKNRLGTRQKTYPRTALLLLGLPGFKRLGFWNNWMETFLTTHADQEPDWLTSYGAWLRSTSSPKG